MKEAELLRLVLLALRTNGWNAAHFGNSVKYVRKGAGYITIPDKDATGFPDIVAVREGRLMFIELKSEKGRISTEQAYWLADLRHVAEKLEALNVCLIKVYVWRPDSWLDGTILKAVA